MECFLYLTKENATQLNTWAENHLGIENKEIIGSNLYQSLLNEMEINVECFRYFGLTGDGFVFLASIIAQSKNLTSLDINTNIIDGEHAVDIAEALAKSESLISLNIGFNAIGEKAVAFVEALAPLKSLTSLNIGFNGITEEHSKAIAKTLAHTFIKCETGIKNFEELEVTAKNEHAVIKAGVEIVVKNHVFDPGLAGIITGYMGNMFGMELVEAIGMDMINS